jgi:hypothetical protein
MRDARNPHSELDEALSRAIHEVLGSRLAMMLHVVASAKPAPPAGGHSEAVLLWLKENMPRTAEKVLRHIHNRP